MSQDAADGDPDRTGGPATPSGGTAAGAPVDAAAMRLSDADRETVARFLHTAMADGRLTVTELDERLAQLYAARTYGELVPLVADLPGRPDVLALAGEPDPVRPPGALAHDAAGPPVPRPVYADAAGSPAVSSSSIAVLGGAERKGEWLVPARHTCVAMLGGVELDLREARFTSAEVTINCTAIMGGVDIKLPLDVNVKVTGFGIMGAFEQSDPRPPIPGAPTVVVTGFALMAGVEVQQRPRKPRRIRGGRRRHRSEGPAELS
jgi:hypothetical protein